MSAWRERAVSKAVEVATVGGIGAGLGCIILIVALPSITALVGVLGLLRYLGVL